MCTMPNNGIKWSAGEIINTCPLDATLQLIITKCAGSKRFAESIVQCNYSKIVMYDVLNRTIELAHNEDWSELQVTIFYLTS